jgi:hypothetical protein
MASAAVITYGIPEFFADIDAGRTHYGNATLITWALSWAAGAGFAEVFGQYDVKERTALEFRQRYILGAIRSRGF